MAEREGFEPPERANAQRFSRPPLSTTQPPLLKSALVSDFDLTSLPRSFKSAFARLAFAAGQMLSPPFKPWRRAGWRHPSKKAAS